MTDAAFFNELWIRAYVDQIRGYPLGHPNRTDFRPNVSSIWKGRPGSVTVADRLPFSDQHAAIDRLATLNLPCYHKFSEEDREVLLSYA